MAEQENPQQLDEITLTLDEKKKNQKKGMIEVELWDRKTKPIYMELKKAKKQLEKTSKWG